MSKENTKPYHLWLSCRNCNKERWVRKDKLKKSNYTGLCPTCSMSLIRRTYHSGGANGNWKTGRVNMSGGYVGIRVYPDNNFFEMADKSNYILEHRLVMATHLGRCLNRWELVHHKNGDKKDNRIENLELLPSKASGQVHRAFTLLQQENKALKEEKEILINIIKACGRFGGEE